MKRQPCPPSVVMVIEIPSFPPNEPDGWQRLRRLLKALLRSYGLRCKSIEPEKKLSDKDDSDKL
jgi:hypothetical protein